MHGINPKVTFMKSHVKFGDHVRYMGSYVGLIVDISADGVDARVERPDPYDGKIVSGMFDVRTLEVTSPDSGDLA